MKKLKMSFVTLLFILIPVRSEAAQFCLEGGNMAPQCIYDDAALCLRDSDPPGTYCNINPEAVLNYSGSSRYCIVGSSNMAECIYNDRSQCSNESVSRKGVCVDRVTMRDRFNPYRYDSRVQN